MPRLRHPLREAEPISRRALWQRRQALGNARVHRVAALIVLPAPQQERRPLLVRLLHHHRHRRALFARRQLLRQRCPLRRQPRALLGRQAGFPLHPVRPRLRLALRQSRIDRRRRHTQPPLLRLLRQRRQREKRRRRLLRVVAHHAIRHPVEEREHPVVIALRDGIELVIVTPRALHRQPEKRRRRRVNPVRHILDAIFLLDDSALRREHMISIEPRRHPLLPRRARQQIPRELLDEKTVERQI